MENINTLLNTAWLDDNLIFSVPRLLKSCVTTHILDKAGIEDELVYGDSETADTYQCYHMGASPTTTDWTKAYKDDNNTSIMLAVLTNDRKPLCTSAILDKVDVDYCSNLKIHHIGLLHDKLILYKPVSKYIKYVGLIIVPTTLRRLIFSHFHAGPSDGHMGE